ncbi:hypothetical protein Droror1_Dr00000132 [Drosera rotundifolia]
MPSLSPSVILPSTLSLLGSISLYRHASPLSLPFRRSPFSAFANPTPTSPPPHRLFARFPSPVPIEESLLRAHTKAMTVLDLKEEQEERLVQAGGFPSTHSFVRFVI